METWHSRKRIFDGRIFSVDSGQVVLDDGEMTQRDVVVHPGGVAVVAEADSDILFVRQFRIAISESMIELPAGILEPGDTPAKRAAVELHEETGYAATNLTLLGRFFVSPGYTGEAIHLFHATGLTHVGQQLEADERLDLLRLPRAAVRAMLDEGAFVDAKTIIGLQLLFART